MADDGRAQPAQYTDHDREVMRAAIQIMAQALVDRGIWSFHATPAAMVFAANLAVCSESTDEEILEEFKKCLLDARTRGATPQ